jgi:large repetitive protein
MRTSNPTKRKVALAASLLVASVMSSQALAVQVTVKDGAGTPITTGARWVLEEDRTFDVVPGVTGTPQAPSVLGKPASETLSLKFHRSYMPVVATGETTGSTIDIPNANLDPTKRYFLSVLPKASGAGEGVYSMSGVPVRPSNGAFPAALTAVVDRLPMKTSQISVLLYQDRNPINAQADAIGEQEHGLCGFEVHLYDAGGAYGASGGRMSTDTYGNPLGTEYPDGDLNNPVMGKMILTTDRNGVLRIRNLAPGKYTIFPFQPQVKPTQEDCPGYYPGPGGEPPLTPWPESGVWMQSSTIEGTQGDDAWVKANEPTYFKEFGPPGHHISKGFVAKSSNPVALSGPGAVSGRVVNIHMSRPPNFAFYNGAPVTQCRIGLNESASLTVGGGTAVFAGPCNSDGTFTISGTKPNTRYQLAVWDEPLDNVFASYDFVTDASGNVDLQDVPVFNWFGHMEGKVCQDPTEKGFCATGSLGVSGQAINIRWRDGSVYQSVATDDEGRYEFPEIFPFFNWMVAEVDFARFKATGMTAVIDHGGPIQDDNAWTMPTNGVTSPQAQFEADGVTPLLNPNTGNNLARTETGPVLTQAIQNFLGLTNRLDWGKKPYVAGENGGVSGIVRYASTRAESDPRFSVGENNEPGIPGVEVRLFLADPFDPRKIKTVKPGLGEDEQAVAVVTTDSWDAANPSGCQGPVFVTKDGIPTDCFDGLRNFNQARNAVFDGGYAFTSYEPNGVGTGGAAALPAGNYIVKVVPPVGYEVQKEEDKNVDFGDYYAVSSLALPPECVGVRAAPVPAELTLFPGVAIPAQYRDQPGKARALCNMKAVSLADEQNAAADFSLFTPTPVAGHIVGMILDDTANEFDPTAPAFGEKYAPPFMPVSLRDMAGREFSRVYSDRYGNYNALVPSTFTFNVPMPSGVSPNMVQACLNSPFSVDPITGAKTLDPHFNKSYTQFCYNFQYLPGKTTYLDTPVLPIAAFAGPQQYSLDCEQQAGTPAIRSVSNSANQGPWVAAGGQQLQIVSMGTRPVLNPAYNNEEPGEGVPKLVNRDFGFGAVPGTVTIGGVAAAVVSWTDAAVVVTVPAGSAGGQLLVTRGDNGVTTARGVSVHVGGAAPTVVTDGQSIQAAVDAALPGALVTVAPGTYEEQVIVDKRVRIQGFGAGATLLNPVAQPTEKLRQWRVSVCNRVFPTINQATGVSPFLLPGQEAPTTLQACLDGNTADNAPLLFGDEEAPGFFVIDRSDSNKALPLSIDGFTIAGADIGGGINVNGYAERLQIANNLITGNQGIRSGGIRVGNPSLVSQDLPVSSRNFDLHIHHNEITQNGDTAGQVGGGGGGIGLYFGSDRYRVAKNFICGNYSSGNGGGLSHLGVSQGGVIEDNQFLWNQSFYQGISVQGGGVAIMGQESLAAAAGGVVGLSTGTGDVTVVSNTFQGNLAGSGDGGAMHLSGVNGNELGVREPYRVDVLNNVIVNNVAAVAGGGIAMRDSPNVRIINNTIAHNDSVAVAARTFNTSLIQGLQNGLSVSTPQPGAGIASYTSSPVLAARVGAGVPTADGRLLEAQFSNAQLANNVVAENRQFYFGFDFVNNDPASPACQVNAATNACYGLLPAAATPVFSDIAIVGDPGALLPSWQAAWTSVTSGNQPFAAQYFNGPRNSIVLGPERPTQNLAVAAAFDEGGNFIDLRFGPLTPLTTTGVPFGNYRLSTIGGSNAAGSNFYTLSPYLQVDRDQQARPAAGAWTVGAFQTASPTAAAARAPAVRPRAVASTPGTGR